MKKVLLSLVVVSSVLSAEGAFSVGHKQFSFGISQDGDYTVIGGSINYSVVDNLTVGFGATTWVGDKPSITRLTLPVTYYMPLESSITPYMGLFTSYTWVGDNGLLKYENYSSFGGRAGLAVDIDNNMYLSAGWVQVKHNNNYGSSSEGYPEFGFGISF